MNATVAGRHLQRLCEQSRANYRNPYAGFVWPETLPADAWCMSPELISLSGTSVFESLSQTARKRLSFFEAVNFFSLNVHGERRLLEGIARRLYVHPHAKLASYLQHFLDEENKHMVYFAEFCNRYAAKIYPERVLAFPRDYAEGEEDFLFFAHVLIFEELVDAYNKRMAQDPRLVPVVREINRLHHLDESRHLAFGRRLIKRLYHDHAPGWSAATLERIQNDLSAYLVATWRAFYNPAAYSDAGLQDAPELAAQSWCAPEARRHRGSISSRVLKFLRKAGILDKDPEL